MLAATAVVLMTTASCSDSMTEPSPMAQPGPDAALVADALGYWTSVLGVAVSTTDTNVAPRILFREGTDGLAASSAGRGGIDGTDAANWATSAFVQR
jgi:hypothetical protein